MAKISILPLSIGGVKPPLNLLASLFSKPGDSKNLTYPLDLSSNPNYGHAVVFSVYDYTYPSASGISDIMSGAKTFKDVFGSGVLTGQGAKPQRKGSPLANISMYMPDTLTTSFDNDYTQVSLTETLGWPGFIGSAIADKGIDLKGTQQDNGNFTNMYAKGAFAKALPGNLGSLAGNVMKQVENPQLQMLYKGINLREFQFEFRFTPTSKQEAQTVDGIIKKLTYYSVPELLGSKSHQFLKPPQLFSIKFAFTGGSGLSGAVSNFFKNIGTNILTSQITGALFGSMSDPTKSAGNAKVFQVYHDCVLTNIQVDYAPNGWSAYNDGYPVETRLTLTFKETDIVTKNDIDPSISNSIENSLNTVKNMPGQTLSEKAGKLYTDLNNMKGFP